MVTDMDIISSELILGIVSFLTAIALVIWGIGFKRILKQEKEDESIVETGKKAIEERRNKLGLNIPRIPLYFDSETLEALYSQSQMRKSPMKIDSIKKVTGLETSGKLDVKIATTKISETELEEYVLKEYQNRENQYENVLVWLCEQDLMTIGLEEPEDINELLEDLKNAYKKADKKSGNILKDIDYALEKVLAWKDKSQLKKLESANNKPIFLKGFFDTTSFSNTEFQIDLNKPFIVYVSSHLLHF